MSQTTDTTLADQSGASFRTELNGILSALNTDFSGSTAPVTPEAYMVWQDTSVTPNVLRRRNGANSAWETYPVVEGATNAAAAKTTPVDADLLPLVDSAASFSLKKLSWLNIKTTLKTYFDTLYLSKAGDTLTGLLKFANGANITAASTVNLSTATGNTVKITGTTGINAWTMTSGQVMDVIFTDVLTLTHNATTNNLNNGGNNIITEANDRARIYYDGTTVWFLSYFRASGFSLAGIPIFTKSYVSSEQVITASGSLTLAHGMASKPKFVSLRLVCKTAELGYSINDEVLIENGPQDFSASSGAAVVVDATNVFIRYGTNAGTFLVFNKTTASLSSITNGNWRLVIGAYS